MTDQEKEDFVTEIISALNEKLPYYISTGRVPFIQGLKEILLGLGVSDKEVVVCDIRSTIERQVNNYMNSLDPCGICSNKKDDRYDEVCLECCYYYGSSFRLI